MNGKLKLWLLSFLENSQKELEDKLGKYTSPTEYEIEEVNTSLNNIKTFRDSLEKNSPTLSKEEKDWILSEIREHIDNIEKMDYMSENITIKDRVAVLEHLEFCRRWKTIIYKWKVKKDKK